MVVWRAKSTLYGDLAIRVPRQRFLKNENDGEIDSRVLLRQEATIARHVAQLGVPTPEVIAVHEAPLGDGVDFLAYEYIDNASDAPCEFELGEVVRAIHDCKPPLIPWAMQGKSLAETIAERVVQRSEAVQRISGTTLPTPSLDTLYELLGCLDSKRPCLLHMDIRPNKNVLTRRGAIVSVIDWANALIGPPDLELARIQEYGLLSTEFLQGYGELEDPLEEAAMILCRLDTAIMLALCFFRKPQTDNEQNTSSNIVGNCWQCWARNSGVCAKTLWFDIDIDDSDFPREGIKSTLIIVWRRRQEFLRPIGVRDLAVCPLGTEEPPR